MPKGIDQKFVHYGIRRDDLQVIETLCEKHEIDVDWIEEMVLKAYHEKKVDVTDISDADTESVIRHAIKKIK